MRTNKKELKINETDSGENLEKVKEIKASKRKAIFAKIRKKLSIG